MNENLCPKRLEAKNIVGAGLQIHAELPVGVDFVEFSMKSGKNPIVIGSELWIQFPRKEWHEMLKTVFEEMVDAWNEKHATETATNHKPEASTAERNSPASSPEG
jgi:hypothetical protein